MKLHRTTAYHPQANGHVERFNRHLKSFLRAILKNSNWLDELSWVFLGITTAVNEDLGFSSTQLVYGTLSVPGDFFDSFHRYPFNLIYNATVKNKSRSFITLSYIKTRK
ncbi:hypothetical protein RF11_09330 [Thelohanellus kitauei]|uniref:Integrase catalytic domain-containing protein n=1 Tax=Thelohanellus kitauei TaxID=669202 RepID=A0A0C2IMV4_THEKT|nr:hypothetical protein RF11_09330 [Thelohanellus kitauei]